MWGMVVKLMNFKSVLSNFINNLDKIVCVLGQTEFLVQVCALDNFGELCNVSEAVCSMQNNNSYLIKACFHGVLQT